MSRGSGSPRPELDWRKEALAFTRVGREPSHHMTGVHDDEVLMMVWSNDGTAFGTASRDGTACIVDVKWEPATCTIRRRLARVRPFGDVAPGIGFSLAWSPCDRFFAVIWAIEGTVGHLCIWDAESGQLLSQDPLPPPHHHLSPHPLSSHHLSYTAPCILRVELDATTTRCSKDLVDRDVNSIVNWLSSNRVH